MLHRKAIPAAVLAAALGAAAWLTAGGTVTAQPQQPTQTPPQGAKPAAGAAAEAAPATAVPVKQVVLFSSGVGYFEHFGTVTGSGNTELRFKTQQINDILKSLVLQDLDGGRVTAVTYPSQDPLAKTLASFEVDVSNNPPLADLLNQLRGARLTVTDETGREISGTVVGVEKKQRPIGEGQERKVVEVSVLNVLTETGFRAVQLDEVRNIQLQDPQLRQELEKALAAVAQARGQDKKPVTIDFHGEGERRVRLGYVVETPVWKTSYRLLLTDAVEGDGQAKPQGQAQPPRNDAAAGDRLQGWAIVENQTDFDWNDVQLSLVSGRPISFIQNLYQPLYIPRPVVQPELYASLTPQTYGEGMAAGKEVAEMQLERLGRQADGRAMRARTTRGAAAAPPAPAAAPPAGGAFGGVAYEETLRVAEPLDAGASVASLASAAKVGELFQYTVGNVSLARQRSAMIPIVTDPVEVQKLSIYNAGVLARHPLYGARVKNTTGKHLLQGPITVLNNGSYAGDARIEDLPPGQERLISYGVDLEVLVDANKNTHQSGVMGGKIVKGVLQLTFKDVFSQEYTAENKGERAKRLVIEHPVRPGWQLVTPEKADETTDQVHRFQARLEPGKSSKLAVTQQLVRNETVAILPTDVGTLVAYARTGQIPKEVREALTKAIQLKQAMEQTQRDIQQRQQRVNEIAQGQARVRENMKTVDRTTDYYQRLLKKFDEEETTIDTLGKEIEALQKKYQQQQQELDQYVNGLNVG